MLVSYVGPHYISYITHSVLNFCASCYGVGCCHIQAVLCSAHHNNLRLMVTKGKPGGALQSRDSTGENHLIHLDVILMKQAIVMSDSK